jgi:hypothetical protein
MEVSKMSDDSGKVPGMEFKRYEHVFLGGNVTQWVDRTFPNCPLCKKPSLWELGNDAKVKLGWKNNMRNYFRCPNCMGIISVPMAIVQKRYLIQSLLKEQNARIESVGNNSSLQNLTGQEYPIKTLQEWASKTE